MESGMWASIRIRNGWGWDPAAAVGVEVIQGAAIPVEEGDILVEVTRATEEDTHEGAEDIRAEGDRGDSVPTKIDLHQRMTLNF